MGEFSRIYKSDLTDRQLADFWGLVKAAGRDRQFAYCLPDMDGEGFAAWMRRPDVEPWIITCRGVPVGMFMLTDRRGKTAEVHFCTLPTGVRRIANRRLGITQASGLYALAQCLWAKNKAGKYIIDHLVGFTPESNTKAVKYVTSIGGRVCGSIPGYAHFVDTGEDETAIVTTYSRETVPAWACRL